MRVFGLLFPLLLVLCLAFWAYQENNLTKRVSERATELQERIEHNRVVLKYLQDEWAFLNRPDRLKELVRTHYAELKLSAVTHSSFRTASSIPLRRNHLSRLDVESGLLLAAPEIAFRGE